ncbi:MAG: AMP-binding protein, partial [Acidobacteriota bacterium]
IGKGDRVALIGENHPCWAIAYLGIIFRGAVCVPIDPHGETATIVNFLNNSEAKLVFFSPSVVDRFASIRDKIGTDITAVAWRLVTHVDGVKRFEDFIESGDADQFSDKRPAIDDSDVALLMYTSGTTGVPKGVQLTHGNIVAELDGINRVLEISESERILSLLPLFHAYLQIANLWIAVTKGCEVGYLKELTPQELSEAMIKFKPTILGTVPRLWYLFHKKIFDAVELQPKPVRALFRFMLAANGFLRDWFKINLGRQLFSKVHQGFGGSLVRAISAGSRFDAEVAVDFHRLGFNILQGYGLTETSGAATATYEHDNRVGSVGQRLFNSEIKIDSPDGEGVGEVLIRGPIVFKGYYKNESATAEAFTDDGWFKSGDLGKMDSEGHLYIVGRAKDVIVLPNGKNVHPEDLEVHYLKSPLVAELAVIGVADAAEKHAGAEKLIGIVVPDFEYLKANKIANSREAIRFALDSLGRELPEYQRVREYQIRAEPLPRTATRKIRRFELRKQIESGALSGDIRAPRREWIFTDADLQFMAGNVASEVQNAIAIQKSDSPRIHPDMNLELDLGLDSLARAEIFAALEQRFSLELAGDDAAEALLVRDVIGLFSKSSADAGTGGGLRLNWGNIVRDSQDEFPEVKGIIRARPFFSLFAYLVLRIFRLFCALFMRLEVSGLENIRNLKGPVIICPNHQSFLDAFVVCCLYPRALLRSIFHVGASEFFEGRIMRRVASILNIVPIDPDTQLMKAMKAGAMGLRAGKVLNIYPEGERGFDGKLHPFKKGAAILASELGVPIVPVALDGLFRVWPRNSTKIRPAKVTVRFGPAINVATPTSATEADVYYEAVTESLKREIGSMLEDIRRAS